MENSLTVFSALASKLNIGLDQLFRVGMVCFLHVRFAVWCTAANISSVSPSPERTDKQNTIFT